MAVNKTGAIFKSLTFDGESSRDYGIYITGEAVFNAPEREVEMIAIPNRNGAFALDKGRFENIEVTYPAGVFADSEADFAKAISDFRNMLCSRKGYCRLTDEYNPDEFRLAVYKSGLEVDPVALRAGEFDITFECKPQRYLMSGQNKFLVTDWNDTTVETGKLISVDDTSGTNGIKDITVDIVPKQDGIPFMTTPIERTPFLFKQTPDSWEKKNTGRYTTLVGADVVENQLAPNSLKNCTPKKDQFMAMLVYDPDYVRLSADITTGHKYLVSFILPAGCSIYRQDQNGFACGWTEYSAQTSDRLIAFIGRGTATNANADLGSVISKNDTTATAYGLRDVQFTDLTAYYGSNAIPDTAYTKEQTLAGSGIAWLKANGFDFSKYRDFNAGTMSPTNPSAMNTVGFNQWDGETESGYIYNGSYGASSSYWRTKNFIKVIAGGTYFFNVPSRDGQINMFDANKTYIGAVDQMGQGNPVALPSNCYYVKFYQPVSTSADTVCINLHYDGSRDGEYEPYSKHEYNIVQYPLHGIFKLVDGNIQADGDVRGNGRTINRKYAEYAVNTSDVTLISNYTNIVYAQFPKPANAKDRGVASTNAICAKYPSSDATYNWDVTEKIGFLCGGAHYWNYWIGFPTGTTLEQAKTALTGLVINYELATPYDETITTGFTNPQVVEEYGTEEFVTSNDVPVGNQTRYGEIYPVSGTDKVHTVVSANLLDESAIIVHKHYNITSGKLVDDTYSLSTPKIPLNGHDKLAVSLDCTYSVPRFQWFVFDESGTKLTTGIDMSEELGNSRYGRIIVIDRDTYPTAYSVGLTFDHGLSDMDGTVSDVMVTYSETYVDYLPYGTEYESDFEQNIWGGPFALLSGTGDSEYGTVDLGTLTWELIYDVDGTRVFGATISDMEEPPDSSYNNTGLYSNAYALSDYIITDPHTYWIGPCRMIRIGHKVYIEDVNFTDADEFKRGVSGIELIYKLDEALEISYTALSLDPLEQTVNYIWNKENYDITVEYGTSPGFIVNPTLFGCGPLIETKGYGDISFNGHTIKLANGTIGTVNLWNRTHGGSLNGSITKKFATGQFNPTDTFSFTVSHMFTLYEDSPSIVNTNGNATNGYSDNNDGSVTYWIDLPCTFTVGTTNQTTNKSTYTFGSKKVIANMSVSYDSSTGTVVYSVTTETVNNPTFASSTQFGFTISDCNATSTLDRLGNPTYIDCDLGEAYKINDGDIVSLNSFIDLGSNLPELASGPNKITYDNTFSEVAITPRWWTV